MATQPLPLSILCDVSVSVTPAGVAVPAFNQALVIAFSYCARILATSSCVRFILSSFNPCASIASAIRTPP